MYSSIKSTSKSAKIFLCKNINMNLCRPTAYYGSTNYCPYDHIRWSAFFLIIGMSIFISSRMKIKYINL